MPFRLAALAPAARPASSSTGRRATPQLHTVCFFHATPPRRDAEIDRASNHYETLKVAPSATPAEIKRYASLGLRLPIVPPTSRLMRRGVRRSFYNLSKTHHPDQSADVRSSERFLRISEAYNTLSSAERRSRYDRDVLGLSAAQQQQHRRSGSYSSTTNNPAGGRPASGLSKRRTVFRGPPPSFYRSGGWGAHSAKRQAAHDDSTGGAGASAAGGRPHPDDGAWATGGAGGMGPGQNPFRGAQDDVPHFDREGHERTGRRAEEARTSRRRTRMDGQEVHVEGERGQAGMFFVIGGILAASFLVPFAASRFFRGDGPKEKKKPR